MPYIKEKLIPGYTGKFVIQSHHARNYHWDLRLSFPVSSVAKALADYSGKRPHKGVEPSDSAPDKSGTVLRSWAIPKHKLPTTKPLLATQTEDHAQNYITFQGTIPEGQYGAGTVEIYDHGTYTLDDVDYDKKYVFTLKGRKVKGTYALIKTSGKSFLWLKTKEQKKACISVGLKKIASAIDYIRPTMNSGIWNLEKDPPMLKDKVKSHILETLTTSLTKNGMNRPLLWIDKLYISDSQTSYNYREDGDFDIDIKCKFDKVRNIYPELKKFNDKELHDHIQAILNTNRDKKVTGTEITYSFLLLDEGDYPVSDGIYDIFENRWIHGPFKIPEDFDPDVAFIKQRAIALEITKKVYGIILDIKICLKHLEKIDDYIKFYDRLRIKAKRVLILSRLKILCRQLVEWRKKIWKLQTDSKAKVDPKYPAFNYSSNWDEKYIIFKYVARYSAFEPIQLLYSQMDEDDPYLPLIEQFVASYKEA